MRKRLRDMILLAIIVLAGIWLLGKLNVFQPIKNLFSSKPVIIDETPILIKEIRSIGQIITATFYDETVVDSVEVSRTASIINSLNAVAPLSILPSPEKRIVLVAKGKVLAGTDLNLLTDSSIKIVEDTAFIQLPTIKIIDAIMNPSDFETFEEKGSWSPEAVTAVKLKARERMIDHAFEQNILNTASNKARAVIEDFLNAVGFKVVIFKP